MKHRFTQQIAVWALASVLCASGAAPSFAADGAQAKETPTASAKPGNTQPGAAALPPESGLAAFCKLLPLGSRNLQVQIPSFSNGTRTSQIEARAMTRVDDDNMDLEKLDIVLFGKTSDTDLNVHMRFATFHLPTEILYSQDRSRVSRTDFKLDGDTLIFDTHTQQGKMTGHVVMVVYNANSLKNNPPPANASKTVDKSKDANPLTQPQGGASAVINKEKK